jgi:hypothetical protein
MKRTLLAALALPLILSTAVAQSIEYGTVDELKGVTKIFVGTGADMKLRREILKEIEKGASRAPDLRVVSRAEDAEVVLMFGAEPWSYLSSIHTTTGPYGHARSDVQYRSATSGGGVVAKLTDGKVRLLMSFKDTKSTRWERKPSTNFAREFMHAYLDANGVKR